MSRPHPADRAVDELIRALVRRGFVVIATTVRDGAIVLDEVRDVSALPIGWTDEQEAATYRLRRHDNRSLFAYAVGPSSPRRFLSPPSRTLWSAVRVGHNGFELVDEAVEPPPTPSSERARQSGGREVNPAADVISSR